MKLKIDFYKTLKSQISGEECRESMSSSPSKQSRASHSSRSSPEAEKDKEKGSGERDSRHVVHSQSEPILHAEKPLALVKRVRCFIF